MPTYTDNEWYCDCGIPAKWYTSRQDGTRGDKFIRCEKSGGDACRFFLWEKDEVAERAKRPPKPSGMMGSPQTPQSNRRQMKFEDITPITGFRTPISGGRSNVQASGRAIIDLSRDTSPTPQRCSRCQGRSGDSRDTALSAEALALLASEKVVLKESTKVQLRHVIDTGVQVYEAKLRRYEQTVAELSKKLGK